MNLREAGLINVGQDDLTGDSLRVELFNLQLCCIECCYIALFREWRVVF